jgi:hypothetical protein
MAISFAQVRSAVSSQVLGLSGFHLSRIPAAYFGRQQNTLAHLSFAVDVPTSSKLAERQRRSVGVYLSSTVNVIFAYRLRPKDVYPTDYDNALHKEQLVIAAVLNNYSAIKPGIEIRYDSSNRTITNSLEYMIITCAFTALHTIQ